MSELVEGIIFILAGAMLAFSIPAWIQGTDAWDRRRRRRRRRSPGPAEAQLLSSGKEVFTRIDDHG